MSDSNLRDKLAIDAAYNLNPDSPFFGAAEEIFESGFKAGWDARPPLPARVEIAARLLAATYGALPNALHGSTIADAELARRALKAADELLRAHEATKQTEVTDDK